MVKTATLPRIASQSSKSSSIMASTVLGKRARAPESLNGTYHNVFNATASTNFSSQSRLPSLRASNGETKAQLSTMKTLTQNLYTAYSTLPIMTALWYWTTWMIHFNPQPRSPELIQTPRNTPSRQEESLRHRPRLLIILRSRNQSQVGYACANFYMV